jgi:hypothetical protein
MGAKITEASKSARAGEEQASKTRVRVAPTPDEKERFIRYSPWVESSH